MTPTKRIGLIAGFALLAAVAIAGWVRSTPPETPSAGANAQVVSAANGAPVPPLVPPPSMYDQYGQAPQRASYSEAVPGAADQGDIALPEFACPHYVRTVTVAAPVQPSYAQPNYGDADRMAPPEPQYRGRREVRHSRSTRHSAEIVAGSAGAGAAIGALAGGGKGAGIGALVGGGGGFIYDRLTRSH